MAFARSAREGFALRYRRYVTAYTTYARLRGFTADVNSWPYVRRSFLECWAQPGFHRFWQVWNPGISYFVYRLFLRLGGRRHWVVPTIASFVLSGVVHTLVVVPFLGRWGFSVITAFTCFGILTVLSRFASPALRQHRWPAPVNVALNVAFVLGSFDVGFRVDRLLGF